MSGPVLMTPSNPTQLKGPASKHYQYLDLELRIPTHDPYGHTDTIAGLQTGMGVGVLGSEGPRRR